MRYKIIEVIQLKTEATEEVAVRAEKIWKYGSQDHKMEQNTNEVNKL
jgi:hypothetical protein